MMVPMYNVGTGFVAPVCVPDKGGLYTGLKTFHLDIYYYNGVRWPLTVILFHVGGIIPCFFV